MSFYETKNAGEREADAMVDALARGFVETNELLNGNLYVGTFSAALVAMRQGFRVWRKEWKERMAAGGYPAGGYLYLELNRHFRFQYDDPWWHDGVENDFRWLPDDKDILANDWIQSKTRHDGIPITRPQNDTL